MSKVRLNFFIKKLNKSVSQIIELGKKILEIVHCRYFGIYYVYLVLIISTFFFLLVSHL